MSNVDFFLPELFLKEEDRQPNVKFHGLLINWDSWKHFCQVAPYASGLKPDKNTWCGIPFIVSHFRFELCVITDPEVWQRTCERLK